MRARGRLTAALLLGLGASPFIGGCDRMAIGLIGAFDSAGRTLTADRGDYKGRRFVAVRNLELPDPDQPFYTGDAGAKPNREVRSGSWLRITDVDVWANLMNPTALLFNAEVEGGPAAGTRVRMNRAFWTSPSAFSQPQTDIGPGVVPVPNGIRVPAELAIWEAREQNATTEELMASLNHKDWAVAVRALRELSTRPSPEESGKERIRSLRLDKRPLVADAAKRVEAAWFDSSHAQHAVIPNPSLPGEPAP